MPISPSAKGGAVKGTISVVMIATTSEISPSSPTMRAKAGEDVAAQPMALITNPATKGPSKPKPRSTRKSRMGQTSIIQPTSSATSTGRRKYATTCAKSTRSSTIVIRVATVKVTTSRNSAAKGGMNSPAKMPSANSSPPRRADHSRKPRAISLGVCVLS